MPENEAESMDNPTDVVYFTITPFLTHNRHVSVGIEQDPLCRLCSAGLEAVFTPMEVKQPDPPPVAEGDGTDQEGTTPPSPSNEPPTWGEVQMLDGPWSK